MRKHAFAQSANIGAPHKCGEIPAFAGMEKGGMRRGQILAFARMEDGKIKFAAQVDILDSRLRGNDGGVVRDCRRGGEENFFIADNGEFFAIRQILGDLMA